MIALRKGNAERVRKIIADGGDDGEIHADMAADSAMNALLHRAARYGHGKVVQVCGCQTNMIFYVMCSECR